MAILLASASLAFLLYVIAFYPLMLGVLARGLTAIRPKSPGFPTVSVILPVHNGEAFVRGKLETLFALDYPADRLQILLISNGSTDSTDDLIRALGAGRVELIQVPRRGKAAALNAGIARATGDILFFTDIRQDLSPHCLRDLVAWFADPDVGVVTGELIIGSTSNPSELTDDGAGLYWRYEVWIRTRLSRLGVLHGATGCIYAMRRECAVTLPEKILSDDVYLPLAVFFSGKRIVLDRAAKAFDHPVRDLGVEFRRKVRTLAGMYQVIGAYPRLLWPGTRGWLHFVSHKVARLFLPFALITFFISSFWLPHSLRDAALVCQAIVYSVALLDFILPRTFPLKWLTSAARTFVVLMAAAFCAALAWLLPSQSLWKQTAIRQHHA